MICHRNEITNPTIPVVILQLQVSCFCEEVCAAVENWLNARAAHPTVAAALARLPLVQVTAG
jgi:hypothetical protein